MSSFGAWAFTPGAGFDEVIRQMPAAVLVVDAGSRDILYANARAGQMAEQLGRPVPPKMTDEDWVIFHPDGRPYRVEEWPLVRSLTTGEDVVDEEYFNLRLDGSRLIVRCSTSPIYDDEGRIVAAVLVMVDVTERKRGEERLGYLAGLLDHTDDAVIALDAQWRLTVWNKGAERMYGWTADEVLGQPSLEVGRPEMGYEERADIRRAAAEQGRWRGEVIARRKDGKPVCVELIVVAVRGERGEITGYLGIHRDVTDRKRAEEALREAQQQSATILERITDAFVAMDRQWRFTYFNERALAQSRTAAGRDVTAEELLGRSIWEAAPELVGTRIDDELHRALREQIVVEFEAYSPPAGRWVEVRVYPSESGVSVYSHDISARKSAQEEMSRGSEQQALVAELGRRALGSDDLQSLMDEAVGLVAGTLDVELAGVAELAPGGGEMIFRAGVGWRNGVVGGRMDRLERDSLMRYTLRLGEPVIVEDMATDRRFSAGGTARDHGVVSAVSVMIESPDEPYGTLAALSTRRRTFSGWEVSFVQAIANVLASAVERSRAQERLIEVREVERRRIARDLHDEALQDLTHALALAGRDPDRPDELTAALERVGERLRGAIYDLRLGGQQGTPFRELLESLVAVHRAMPEGDEIELDVGDGVPDGPLGATGIEMLRILGEALTNARRHARATRVRVRVWRSDGILHAEVCDDGQGFDAASRPLTIAGHGMTGMRERADRIHGRLDIATEPAAGTTVRLDVPLQPARVAVEEARVLLVEDHIAVRQAIAATLEREPDLTVVGEARSLAEARELLHDVDVALIDLGLPDGDGADLIAELRKASPGAQALVLTANLDRAQTARAIEAGAAGAFGKTAGLDRVVDAVRRLRSGQTLLAMSEVVDLLRFADGRREQERKDRRAIASLSPREREVLQALGAGLDSQAIADRLAISVRTERNHVARILGKLGVHSQLQAVLLALRYGVIDEYRELHADQPG